MDTQVIHIILEKISYCTGYLKIKIRSFSLQTNICGLLLLITIVSYSQSRNLEITEHEEKNSPAFHHQKITF